MNEPNLDSIKGIAWGVIWSVLLWGVIYCIVVN